MPTAREQSSAAFHPSQVGKAGGELLWNLSTVELPGVLGDGMSGRNVQRKTGTARGRVGRMGSIKC